jgi:GT2 family glycosyltransferase
MILSVIIVNYNVCYFLEQCLCSVLSAGQGYEIEIIVVDNASSDDSREYLPVRFPGVKFIWNETNPGFGIANNQAMAVATGKYFLLLNPDTVLTTGSVKTCLDFFASHADAGAVGMRMYDGNGNYLPESKRGFPDVLTSFYKLSGLISLFPRHRQISRYYLGHLSTEEVQQIDVISGAFMLFPRKVYELVGGFDERFFLYGEDIDLSYRVRKAGFNNYYLPLPGLIHFKGESTPKDLEHTRHFYEAMSLFVGKHFGGKAVMMKWMLNAAIIFRGTMSGFRRMVKFSASADLKRKPAVNHQFTVLGDPIEARELLDAVSGTGAGNFSSGGEDGNARGSDIVYCLGKNYPLEKIISDWQKGIRRSTRNWFHFSGTSSIVGSTDKKSRGEVILLKKPRLA